MAFVFLFYCNAVDTIGYGQGARADQWQPQADADAGAGAGAARSSRPAPPRIASPRRPGRLPRPPVIADTERSYAVKSLLVHSGSSGWQWALQL